MGSADSVEDWETALRLRNLTFCWKGGVCVCTLRCVWLRRRLVAECGCVRHCGSARSVVGAGTGAVEECLESCAQERAQLRSVLGALACVL